MLSPTILTESSKAFIVSLSRKGTQKNDVKPSEVDLSSTYLPSYSASSLGISPTLSGFAGYTTALAGHPRGAGGAFGPGVGRGQLGGEVVVVTMVSQSVAAQPVKESHEDAVDVMVEVDVPVMVMDSVTPVEQMDAVDV